MAELPKREQAHPTFDTLYTLAKKLEAGQPARACCYAPSSDAYQEKHRHYPTPTGRVVALEEEGVASANPTSGEDSKSEVEAVDGLNVCLAQVMSHYQREEWKCFVCGSPGHFARDCPHHDAFKRWHWEQLNAKVVGKNSLPTPRMMNQQPVVNVHVTGRIWDLLLEAGGPATHWIGPETLVDLMIEGRNVNALVDSGSQVNTIMPTFVRQYGFPVLPLEDLVNHLLSLVGLGRKCTSPLKFVILHMQVREITGYDEDIVFLVVPDESEFGHRVPLVIGTCTIGQIINVIWESEIDHLSMPWATARMVQLLSCWKSMAVFTLGSVGEAQSEGTSGGPQEVDMDELVIVRESILLGPFQTEIMEGRIKPLFGDTTHVMITPMKAGEGQPQEARPLPLGLHILHAYTHLKNGSSRVSLMVRNMSNSHIFLKKGVLVVRVMLASPVPPTELSPEMEAALGMKARPEPMSVVARQEKLLEKLNLDGLAHWFPRNAAVVRELVLAYHDVFTLESNELGCTSAIEHEICIENSEPFKEWFRHIPLPLLEEVHTSLRDMLEAGAIRLSQSLWCNVLVFVRKKDGTLHFCVDFRHLNMQMKKDLYPLPHIQEALESMVGSAHFSSMDFKSGFWKIKMASESQQYTAFTVTSDSMCSPACHSGCAMSQQFFSILCKIHWANRISCTV